MKCVAIFDLDSTLIPTQLVYSRAIGMYQLAVLDMLGRYAPHIKDIGNLFDKIDTALVKDINPRTGKPYGFSQDRFFDAMIATFIQIINEARLPVLPEQITRIREIASAIGNPESFAREGVVKGAREVLSFFKARDYKLILLTKSSDEAFQREKIDAVRIKSWFSKILVVPQKDPALFKELSTEAPTALSIGDSFPADIAPALEAGMRGVFIPSPDRWSYELEGEDELKKKYTGRFITLRDIREIPKRYKEICGETA